MMYEKPQNKKILKLTYRDVIIFTVWIVMAIFFRELVLANRAANYRLPFKQIPLKLYYP